MVLRARVSGNHALLALSGIKSFSLLPFFFKEDIFALGMEGQTVLFSCKIQPVFFSPLYICLLFNRTDEKSLFFFFFFPESNLFHSKKTYKMPNEVGYKNPHRDDLKHKLGDE